MTFKKFKKKPIVIEAIQWTGEINVVNEIISKAGPSLTWTSDNKLIIHTLEGNMVSNIGDYIIIGVAGEVYSCKQEIFELTYEEV